MIKKKKRHLCEDTAPSSHQCEIFFLRCARNKQLCWGLGAQSLALFIRMERGGLAEVVEAVFSPSTV